MILEIMKLIKKINFLKINKITVFNLTRKIFNYRYEYVQDKNENLIFDKIKFKLGNNYAKKWMNKV